MGNRESRGPAAKVVALGVVVCLISAACSTAASSTPPTTSSPSTPSPTTPPASGCLVGGVWNYAGEERIQAFDEPAMEKQILAAGDRYDSVEGRGALDTQAQIDKFVADGAKVIVIRSGWGLDDPDAPAVLSAIERAVDAGVAVIDYDGILGSPKALLVTFDPIETGRIEARAIVAAVPKGNYVILKGHPEGQVVPDLMVSGIHEVLQPAIDSGDVKIVAETYIVNWDPYTAMEEMRSILSANHNSIDAVIAESNGMASGVIAALREVGLDGKVAVAGQGGGDDMWNFNHVAAGTQTVDVWTDLRLMGKAAGDAAVALCKDPDISKLVGTSQLSLPGRGQVTSILLTPQAITKDNLNLVIDSGWVKKADVCASLDPSGAPPACQ